MLNHSLVPVGSTGYDIDNSLRFNDDDSAYLSRTPSSAGNRKTFTYSCWFKKNGNQYKQTILSSRVVAGTYFLFEFRKGTASGSDELLLEDSSGITVMTSAKFRDESAWYNIVLSVDTTQAIADNRVKIYINGVLQETNGTFSRVNPTQNADTTMNRNVSTDIGRDGYDSNGRLNGYLAEVNFVDGQALTPSDFGTTGTYGEWKAIEYAGTYGTNGFYLNFLGNSVPSIEDATSTYSMTASSLSPTTTYKKFDASSLHFNSTSSQISVASSAALYNDGSNSRTYEMWVYYESANPPANNLQIAKSFSPSDWMAPYCWIGASDKKAVAFSQRIGGSFTEVWSTSNTALTADTWNHVAIVYTGLTMKTFLNGAETSSVANSVATMGNTGQPIYIGQGAGWYVDEIRWSSNARYSGSYTIPTSKFVDDANTLLIIHSDYDEDNSLGADNSPNNNHWTPNNLAATDQMLDSPTNNFATLNPLALSNAALAEGNLKFSPTGNNASAWSTIAVNTGKWYFEMAKGTSGDAFISLAQDPKFNGYQTGGDSTSLAIYMYYNTGGSSGSVNKFKTNNTTSYDIPSGFGNDDNGTIYGVTLDFDADQIIVRRNNDDSTKGTFSIPSALKAQPLHIGYSVSTTWPSGQFYYNFGQDSSFAGNKTAQGNQDSNGIGDFYYTPPTGFLALCTQNLPEPTVVPSEHFNTITYSGTGTTNSLTGVGFQPDWVWVKKRSNVSSHRVWDAVRGTSWTMTTSGTNAEHNETGGLTSFDSDGFTTNTDDYSNGSGSTFVAWNWKANGAGVTNNDGTIESTVSANADAGFSIVNFTGTGANATVGHGLNSAPEMIIFKNRDSGTSNWITYAEPIGNNYNLFLNLTNAKDSDGALYWQSTSPTSTVFTAGGYSQLNASGQDTIGYAFHSVEGYSKVGSYTGNGSTDGPFVHCGFKPAYVMIKDTTAAGHWGVLDNTRDTYNPVDNVLIPNISNLEYTWGDFLIDYNSNGFKLRGTSAGVNTNGDNYIFIAFAEHPFKYTNAR